MRRPERHHVYTFLGGVAAAFIIPAFAKSRTAHRLAVNGMAGGMRLKDEAVRKAEMIREDAADIYEEARRGGTDEEIR